MDDQTLPLEQTKGPKRSSQERKPCLYQEFETGVQDEQAEEEDLPYGESRIGAKIATSRESARDVYSKRRIIAVTKVEIVEWHDYKHLDWMNSNEGMMMLSTIKVTNLTRVRLRFSDPMIQPEPEGSTQGDPLVSVEVLRFNTSAGNPVKKILLKLNLSDHRLCKMVVECQSVKVKEFQERCNIKAFQEWYEHVGPEVASPQDGKVTRWRRDCAWLMISRCSRSLCQIQVQGTSSIQEVNDHYNIFTRESQEYELKTKDKA
ncbi:hypothetical protein Tco_0565244 [Tanacetum coccineum]